jgi:hypothetical protein
MPLLGLLTDGEIATGLAPEIPEDLYMLIKKVNMRNRITNFQRSETNWKISRLSPSESTSSATEKTRTASSV